MSGTAVMAYSVIILILANVWPMYEVIRTRFLIKNKVRDYSKKTIVVKELIKYYKPGTFVIIAISLVLLLNVISSFLGLAFEINIHDPEESRMALISLLGNLFIFNFIYMFIKFACVRLTDIKTTNKGRKYGLFIITTTIIQIIGFGLIPFFWVLTWGANPFR